ncbi:hypothetical protein [Denitrobaculum tricleocarpae]|uniref:Uncharacterized protein n=1 Tax=Denitrobaculum tricleocarpae TaxID=2591009 RepID=A0A545TSW1_9PROT|nr:hypothetical protein [Denitrobaculum tricleocarpae]TQV80313.1 hypothetical protein FKG95_08955 [Denitrobaculum tricleocarpae]
MAGRFAIPRESEYGSNGEPLAGAKLFFYETQTSTPNDTFSDDALTVANTNPVVADAAGRFGDIFLKNEDYKVILKTSADVTVYTADPVRSPAATTKEVVAVSTTSPVGVSDDGKLFVADATAAPFTITLPPAASAGNGFEVPIGKIDPSLNAVTVDADGSETINGASDLSLPGQWDFATFRSNGTQWYAHVLPQTPGNTPLPRSYLAGFAASPDAGDPANDVTIGPGSARDDNNSVNMILDTDLVKRIDAAWAVGSGGGGLDTGSATADTVYHLWLIQRTDTGNVDCLFSLSSTNPTMPTNYDKKRRIGTVSYDGSSNLAVVHTFSTPVEGRFQKATTEGTSVTLADDLTDLETATRIEIRPKGVSTNTNGQGPVIRVGPTAGAVDTGYDSNATAGGANSFETDGLHLVRQSLVLATHSLNGTVVLSRDSVDSNFWQFSGSIGVAGLSSLTLLLGSIDLSGPLTNILVTTPGGVALFDAGEIVIIYS